MSLSDRELNNVISFYMGLRKVVVIAGVAVLLAAVVAAIALVYDTGRKTGGNVPAAASPQVAPNLKPRRALVPSKIAGKKGRASTTKAGRSGVAQDDRH